MALVELFSERLKRERGTANDVLEYDNIPTRFRQQCIFILQDVFGNCDDPDSQDYYKVFVAVLRRELGVQSLSPYPTTRVGLEYRYYLLEAASNTEALDAIELAFRLVCAYASSDDVPDERKARCAKAIDEMNGRLRKAGLGYRIEGRRFIRVDCEFLHAEAVKPALTVLSDPAFTNASAEFAKAHEHWRNGYRAEVLVDCLKAFESTMVVIANERGWGLPNRLTANDLCSAMLDNGLVPSFYANHFAGLRSVLQGGIPTPRNRLGGHGGGAAPAVGVPEELVRYVLHLTASTILFLVDAHKARE